MSNLIGEFRKLSMEDLLEISKLLEAAKYEKRRKAYSHTTQTISMKPQVFDAQGRLLTGEEAEERQYNLDHPLQLWRYGSIETIVAAGQKEKRRYLTDKEVEDRNAPLIEAWIREKRKFFPNAIAPKTPGEPTGR